MVGKLCYERFSFQSVCKNGSNTVEGVQRFRFKNKTRGSGKIKAIISGSTITVIFWHRKMGIREGCDGFRMQQVVVIHMQSFQTSII